MFAGSAGNKESIAATLTKTQPLIWALEVLEIATLITLPPCDWAYILAQAGQWQRRKQTGSARKNALQSQQNPCARPHLHPSRARLNRPLS